MVKKYWFKLPFGLILWPFKDVLVIKQEILWYYGNRSCYFFLFSRTWWSLMKTREYFQEVYRMFTMLMTLIWYGNLLFDSITWYIFSSVNQFLRFTNSFVVRFLMSMCFYVSGRPKLWLLPGNKLLVLLLVLVSPFSVSYRNKFW